MALFRIWVGFGRSIFFSIELNIPLLASLHSSVNKIKRNVTLIFIPFDEIARHILEFLTLILIVVAWSDWIEKTNKPIAKLDK